MQKEPPPKSWKSRGWAQGGFGQGSVQPPLGRGSCVPAWPGGAWGGQTHRQGPPSHITCRHINKDTRKPSVLLGERVTRQRQAPAGRAHPAQVSDGLAEALARRGGYGDRGATPGDQEQAEEPLQVAVAPRLKQPLPLMQSSPNFRLAAVAEIIRQSDAVGAQHGAEGQLGREGQAAPGRCHQSGKGGSQTLAASTSEPQGGG